MEQQPERNEVRPETEEKKEHVSVFRQKSIDRISSPEQLNDYIRVASPRMWVVLIAVVVFLVGAIIWGVFGRIDSSVYSVSIVSEGQCTVYIPQGKTSVIHLDDYTIVYSAADADTLVAEARVLSISAEPFPVSESFLEYARLLGEFSIGEWICAVSVGAVDLPDGIYYAAILEESISPLSLLTNKN